MVLCKMLSLSNWDIIANSKTNQQIVWFADKICFFSFRATKNNIIVRKGWRFTISTDMQRSLSLSLYPLQNNLNQYIALKPRVPTVCAIYVHIKKHENERNAQRSFSTLNFVHRPVLTVVYYQQIICNTQSVFLIQRPR